MSAGRAQPRYAQSAEARRRRRREYSALGARTGLCVHMRAAALGVSAIATRPALAFTVVKPAGAAALIWLGVRALTCRRRWDRATGGLFMAVGVGVAAVE
ncbi:LysE family transporter [Streptomyces venezuelae]|uniref:LysE family transporter n=1 Tax=Streptomyces venezuelae TaxID=54571 RepID=UPI001CC26987|nr:LysE family transporter [Streptomyces venezuelae]